MGFLQGLQRRYQTFRSDRPGNRFIHLYRRLRRSGLPGRVILGALAVVFIIIGILLGLVPGVPGIVLGVLGAGMIAAQFKPTAKAADTAEVWGRNFLRRAKGRFKNR